MVRKIVAFLRDARGVSALEYAILVGLIVAGVATAIGNSNIQSALNTAFGNVSSEISGNSGSGK